MGEKGKQRRVTISKEFYLGKFLVTQAQWQAVMGNNPSHFKGDPNLPVESVSWNDCQAFIKKLNELAGTPAYRLPTEEEWEYACRAGSKTDYSLGDSSSRLREYAWYDENSGRKTHPVGQLRPNAWGLYDMYGNVWEWMHNKYYEDMTAYRAMRGGSYENDNFELRCGERWENHAVYPWSLVGFRMVCP